MGVIGFALALLAGHLVIRWVKAFNPLGGFRGLHVERLVLVTLLLNISFTLTGGYVTFPPFNFTWNQSLIVALIFMWIMTGAIVLTLMEIGRRFQSIMSDLMRNAANETD